MKNTLFCKSGYTLSGSLFLLLLSSCSSLQEVPNSLNMPLAAHQHDTKISANIGTGGLALQASYAIDSHFVLTSSTLWNFYSNGDGGSNSVYHKELLEDIGAGYYFNTGNNYRFEVIGGIGLSSTIYKSAYEDYDLAGNSYYNNYFNGNILHTFLQADGGIVNRKFSLGLGLRLSDRYYTGNYEDYTDYNHPYDHEFSDYKYHLAVNAFYVEPGITASFGAGNLKLNIMAGLSLSTTNFYFSPAPVNEIAGLPIFLSLGLTYVLKTK